MSAVETRIAYLRPGQIAARLREASLVFVPVGPLEWHGEHLPYGVDPFCAQAVARAVCDRTGGLVWPTLFWGTERERSPETLAHLGLPTDRYVVGMDFPGLSLPSAYCPEELFALVVRDTLRQVLHLGARRAVIINGHGAVNHNQALRRLETELNHTGDLRVMVRTSFPRADIQAGSIGHAAGDETSLLMLHHPQTVDLGALPPASRPLRYADHAIVDGRGFDGGRPDHTVEDDPRTQASADRGRRVFDLTVSEITTEVRAWLAQS